MTFIDLEREVTYKVIEEDGYFNVGFSLPGEPDRFHHVGGYPPRTTREAAELDLETLADMKGLRRIKD